MLSLETLGNLVAFINSHMHFLTAVPLGDNLDWRKCGTSLKGFYLLKVE